MIKEERVKINGEVELGATIAYQEGSQKRPLVLLIAGTGNANRDGNMLGAKFNLYKDLSDHFVNNGYVCVRYDKRGTHESEKGNEPTSLTDLVTDAKSIIEYAKGLDIVDSSKVVVCGHSEGCMVATLLSSKMNVDGIILLAGAGTSLKEAMIYQNELIIKQANEGKGFINFIIRKTVTPSKVEKQVEELYQKAFKSNKPKFFFRGAFFGTKYFNEHGALTGEDYVDYLKAYSGEILAITGKKDLQADYTRLDSLSSLANAMTCSPENMNHMLKAIDENDSNLIINIKQQYPKLIKKEFDPELIETIMSWMKTKIDTPTKTEPIEATPVVDRLIINQQAITQTIDKNKKRR